MLDGLINKFRVGDDEEDDYTFDDMSGYQRPTRSQSEPKVKEFPNSKTSQYQEEEKGNIIISRPKRIDDAKEIIDHLMSGNSVTIDLEKAEGQIKQRIMDMIVGYGYCANCNIERVNDNIFVVSHVDIQVND